MMELFGLVEDRYNSIYGVSMVPGTFNAFPSFHLHSNALLAQPTRWHLTQKVLLWFVHALKSDDHRRGHLHDGNWLWLTGSSIQRGFRQTTPSHCCSDCCTTLQRSPSPSGRSSTKITILWLESFWTVSEQPQPSTHRWFLASYICFSFCKNI